MNGPKVNIDDLAEWPASSVEMWTLDRIIPYEKNPRTHPQSQIDLLAKLMQRYGVDQPIVTDENGIILKGHGRKLAAVIAGFKTFPVVVHKGLSDEDKQALRIADNQTSLLSRWDDDLLRNEIEELFGEKYDLQLLGFNDGELNSFFLEREKGATDPTLEWQGMPEFVQLDKTAFRSVIVHFKNQKAVNKFQKVLGIVLPEKQKYIWYPKIEIEKYVDKEYADVKNEPT